MDKLKSLRRFFGTQNMTVGSPLSCLLKFSIPMLLGNFAQLLYGMADSIIVGRYIGDAALSAIGTSGPIINLFLLLYMAIGSGVSIMVAQYFGAKQTENLSDTIGSSISLIIISTVFITAVATPLTGTLMHLIKAPEESYKMAVSYATIIFFGNFANGFFNIISGILRGLGEVVLPLVALLIAVVLNVGLDIWFVAGFGMGVSGAALATIISQTVAFIICITKLLRMKHIVKLSRKSLRPKKRFIKQIIQLGVPMGITQGIFALSMVFVQSIINGMGYLVAAACAAVMRVDAFVVIPSQTYNMAISTYTGQNIGAGRMDRVVQGAKALLRVSVGTAIVLIALLLIFGRWMIGLFTTTQEVIDMGIRFITIMIPGYLIISISQSFNGVIRGAGDTVATMWITILTNVVVRVPLAFILAKLTASEIFPGGNPNVLFYTLIGAFCINLVLTLLYYKKRKWRNKAIV